MNLNVSMCKVALNLKNKSKRLAVLADVHQTWSFHVVFNLAKDGQEMCQELLRKCSAVALLNKLSHCRRLCNLLKLPNDEQNRRALKREA